MTFRILKLCCISGSGERRQPSARTGAYWWHSGDAARGTVTKTAGRGKEEKVDAGTRASATLWNAWRISLIA